MTEFKYEIPKRIQEARLRLFPLTELREDDEQQRSDMMLVAANIMASIEARMRWIAENQDELYFEYTTEDIGYSWENVLRVYSTEDCSQVWSTIVFDNRRQLKNKFKRFGISRDNLTLREMH